MRSSSATESALPFEAPPERLVLIPGGDDDPAPHPAGQGHPPEGMPHGYFDASVLLLIGEQDGHGYDLLIRVAELGIGGTDTGALYRRLRRFERDGLVTSRWDHAPSGPPRRTYSLTADGVAWLAAYAANVHRTRRLLSTFVHRYRVAQLE